MNASSSSSSLIGTPLQRLQTPSTSATNSNGDRNDITSSTLPRTTSAAGTLTITHQEGDLPIPDILTLTLQPRPNVQWDENVINNEGLGRKSSKRCCIFHKQRAFGESSTDSSDYDSEDNDSNKKPMARKKKGG